MLVVNGIDVTSGDYLLAPINERDLSRAITGSEDTSRPSAALLARHRRSEDHLAPRFGIDETDLSQAGWGVVLAMDADGSRVSALRPLLDLRRGQASARDEHLYREFTGEEGYRPGDSKDDFLGRHGAGPGPVRPEVVPYYLLLVGGPDEIPFDFQYQLGVQHAVGRLAFDDEDQYAVYAANVVAAETRNRVDRPPRFSVFAPRNHEDAATELSTEQLVLPLADQLDDAGWDVTRLVEQDAHKEQLMSHLAGADRPDLLLTVSHGAGYPRGHPGQRSGQGALLCQDWPGPGSGPVTAEHLLAGSDVAAAADLDLSGMIAVCFACFGAGTPRYDEFPRLDGPPTELAVAPFVAGLPQTMLGRENGALAVVGHVDRAWGYSFAWPGAGAQTEVFRSLLARVHAGDPLGAAMSYLTDRHAEVATELAMAIEQVRLGRRTQDAQFAGLWTAYADARDFAVLGDPAVSLTRVAQHRPNGSSGQAISAPAAPVPAPGDTPTPPSAQAVQVATYVSEDMSRVQLDPATGRITGAELALLSHVEPDGTASHVVGDPATANPRRRAAQEAVVDIHARLLEVSVAARRARTSTDDPGSTR